MGTRWRGGWNWEHRMQTGTEVVLNFAALKEKKNKFSYGYQKVKVNTMAKLSVDQQDSPLCLQENLFFCFWFRVALDIYSI